MRGIKHKPRRDSESGFILFAVLLFTLMVGGLSVAFLSENISDKMSTDLRKNRLTALQICEKAIAEATLEILSQEDRTGDGIGAVSGLFAGGDYEVTSTQSPDSEERWVLLARGTYQQATRRVEVGLRRRGSGDYVEGLFAKDTLTFNGRTGTDAYDSRLGSYSSQAVNSDDGGDYALGGGNVGSNSAVVLHGSRVLIRGNAIPGPSHLVMMSGSPEVWGDIMPRRMTIDLPPASQAEFQAAFETNNNADLINGNGNGNGGGGNGGTGNGGGNGGNGGGNGNSGSGNGNSGGGNEGGGGGMYDPDTYSITGNSQATLDLPGGTYFFTSVRLTGQAKLMVDGPSVVYVTGDFDVSGGGLVNSSGKPADFQVFAHPYAMAGQSPGSSHVKLRGGANAAIALYAPGAALTVHGGDDIFGAFVAETITIAGNSRFHYDKALSDVGGHSKALIERLYWRDLDDQFRR